MDGSLTVSFNEACTMLGISRQQGSRLVEKGEFPVPVLKLGRNRRVPTAPLRKLLGVEGDQ